MKRAAAISFIVLATLTLLVFSAIPHHHHGGAICVIMERCEKDGELNDHHTNHNAESDLEDDQPCIIEIQYTAPQANKETKCKISLCDNKNSDHSHSFSIPVYFLLSVITDLENTYSLSKSEYGEYVTFYKSAEVSQFNGLRAPPHTFS